MENNSPQIQIIGQLAREYEEKYRELEALILEIPKENVLPQLKALAERSTDRFRSAQVALLGIPGLFEGEDAQTATLAVTALGSAFDEMRILFQSLLENLPEKSDS
ncbi:MAG: hypothetical protein AB9866_28950 [Syntrophobacteraceae bacterium]